MGFGKIVKKATKVVSSPKGLAGLVAAPFTGGASLALTGKEAMDQDKAAKKKEAAKELAAEERRAAIQDELDTELRRKNKMASIAARQGGVTGLASLIGSGTEYFG